MNKKSSLSQLTDLPGNEIRARLSPDGRFLAFQSINNGDGNILVKDLETSEIYRVAESPNNEAVPTWSPNSKELIYMVAKEGSYGLFRKNVNEGPEREVFFEDSLKLSGPDWSPDGRYVAATGLYKNKYYQWVIDLQKNDIRRVTFNGDEYNGKWSRDGRHLIYYTGRNDSIMTVDLSTGSLKCLSGISYTGYYPEIGPDNEQFVFTTHIGGVQNIWLGNRNHNEILRLTNSEYNYFPSWHPDGENVVFSRRKENEQLYSYNINSGQLTQLTHSHTNKMPIVSKEGNVAHIQIDEQTNKHFICTLESGRPKRIGPPFEFLEYLNWSGGGESIVFTGTQSEDIQPDQSLSLYLIDITTGSYKEIVAGSRLRNPVWIHGTRLVVYSDIDNKLNQILWKVNVDTKEKSVLLGTEHGVFASQYNHQDSSVIFHERINYGDYRLYELDLRSGQFDRIMDTETTPVEAKWDKVQNRLLYLTRNPQFDIKYWDRRSGKTCQLTNNVYVESPPSWLNDQEIVFSMNANDLDIWTITLETGLD